MEQLSRIEAEQQRLLMIQTSGVPMIGGMMMAGGPGGLAMMAGAAPGVPVYSSTFSLVRPSVCALNT